MENINDKFKKHDLELAGSAIATSAIEAASIADSIGYPVALKIESKDILHKTDIGGVQLA
jgi:acyl-CoA synthetase (NDP forming)